MTSYTRVQVRQHSSLAPEPSSRTKAKRHYSMAGNPGNTVDGISSINAYDINNDSWSGAGTSGGAYNKLDRAHAMYATAESGTQSLGFLTGGNDTVPRMVTFDSTYLNNLTWINKTSGIPYFRGCSTQYVRFGTQGVLVSVGGFMVIY